MASSVLRLLIFVLWTCNSCVHGAEETECTEAIQGDVLLGHYRRTLSGRRRVPRSATAYKAHLWPNRTVPYVFSPKLKEWQKLRIRRAMTTWENHTCIRFARRENETDYVNIVSTTGCCSLVGREGGMQSLVLGFGCYSNSIILHELGHVIGFWHEQSRPDRDDYVDIRYENIFAGDLQNFDKKLKWDINSLGQPFDYGSIMLYGATTFSINRKRTIIPKYTTYNLKELGPGYYLKHSSQQPTRISNMDILQVHLLYKCPYEYENGVVLVGLDGNLTSPNFPKSYPKSRDLTWTIMAAEFNNSNMLVLLIDEFHLGTKDPDGECRGDWLEIREGSGPKAPYLAKICGSKSSSVLAVFSNSLYIKLHSTNSTKTKPSPTVAAHQPIELWWLRNYQKPAEPAVGFSMRYKVSDCKFMITAPNGTIQSPEYPSPYRENIDCIWQISAPKGFRIKITFEDLDFEAINKENGCVDFLEMREGTRAAGRFLSLNCGRDFPEDQMTESNHLRILMHTGSRQTRRGQGFKAHYEFVDIDECEEQENLCEQGCINMPGWYTCGCFETYRIVDDGNGVKCSDIDECQTNNGGCSHYCTNTKGGYFCTCLPGYYLDKDGKTCRDSDECRLSICSQNCVNTPGSFICSCKYGYALDDDKKTCKLAIPMCTGVLTADVGKFTSPPIPSWYRGSVDCEWTIRVRQRYTIGMYLTLLWSRDEECRNYIKISLNEGSGMHSLTLCGRQDVQGLLHFKANELRVHYHTKAPYPEGFSLRYHMRPKKEELCGGSLYRAKGTIQSPNYPSPYPRRSNCLWKIKSPRGRGALLFFERFDLENQSHCRYDFLDLQTKTLSKHMRPIGRFCGTKKPPLIIVKEGELWITFHSDGTVQKRGFKAKYFFR